MKKLPIASINSTLKSSRHLIAEVVQRYVARFQQGDHIEPVTVYDDGTSFWLFDGFHRLKAATLFGRHEIDAEIIRGSFEDMEKRRVALTSPGA